MMFKPDDTVYLYNLTSTYLEGQSSRNPHIKRGYARNKRTDFSQVLLGLVLDRDSFPKTHEVFALSLQDGSRVDEMPDVLERCTGKKRGGTFIVSCGIACDENFKQIQGRGLHSIVVTRQPKTNEWLDGLDKEED
jgi:transposase